MKLLSNRRGSSQAQVDSDRDKPTTLGQPAAVQQQKQPCLAVDPEGAKRLEQSHAPSSGSHKTAKLEQLQVDVLRFILICKRWAWN